MSAILDFEVCIGEKQNFCTLKSNFMGFLYIFYYGYSLQLQS